jgi:hypothetical protein
MPSPNPLTRRSHTGAAEPALLTTSMSTSDLAFSISTSLGWPTGANGPFFVVIDPGTGSEEKLLCSNQSSGVVTVAGGGRGADGTTARTHQPPARVYPCWTGVEADELNEHAAAATGVHGAAGAVVGTTDVQALTNKTLAIVGVDRNKITGFAAGRILISDAITGDLDTVGIAKPAGTVVGTTDTQTLTNKTISGASNTLSNIAESSVTNLTTDLAARQPLDATLTSLAAFNTNGSIHQTAADTFVGRTLTAANSKVVITNGDGVSGNPTVGVAEANFTGIPRTGLAAQTADTQNVYTNTAGATWTKPGSATFIGVWAECQGAGGAGGGAAATAATPTASPGSGGNGGNFARVFIPAASLGSTVAVTVGTGGTGVAGADGNAGGGSSFGAHVAAAGGSGGASAAASASAAISSMPSANGANSGSAASRLDVSGGYGDHGVRISGSFCWAGFGGGAYFAGGISPGPTAAIAPGTAGQTYGGGGSGARNTGAASAAAGGAGAQGCVVITEIYS